MANPLDNFSSKRGSVDVKIRAIPKLNDFFSQFGFKDAIARFDQAMEIWRQDLQRIFPSDETITNTVTTIIQTVNSSTGGGGGSSTPAFDPSALIAQINALTASLAAHIAQNIVHGTSSPVVGETDEQVLERKTIGEASPRNARFIHALQRSEILAGEVFTVPTGFNMVVAGPFTVNIGGSLIVDGAAGFV